LIVFEDEFHGVVLAADLQSVLEHGLDAVEHPRRGRADFRRVFRSCVLSLI
jgi:hypothetical protein